MSGISFTAIDFETANSDVGSVCGVGLVKVRDGYIADKASWLIKPPPALDHFDPVNTDLHGIRAEDVRSAADWEMSVEGILQFTCEDRLVAYNAPYDAHVMYKASHELQLDLPYLDFYCALRLAQSKLKLAKHSLRDVTAALTLQPVEHQGPGADALACAKVVLAITAMHPASSVAEIWDAPAATIGRKPQGRRRL